MNNESYQGLEESEITLWCGVLYHRLVLYRRGLVTLVFSCLLMSGRGTPPLNLWNGCAGVYRYQFIISRNSRWVYPGWLRGLKGFSITFHVKENGNCYRIQVYSKALT